MERRTDELSILGSLSNVVGNDADVSEIQRSLHPTR